jgi:hypothetical protein
MLEPDRSWTVRGRAYPLIAASRLAKGEQPVNVAAHSPVTTTEAARNRRDGRAESMTCTSILIQKSLQPAQLTTHTSPVRLVIWSIWCLSHFEGDTHDTSHERERRTSCRNPVCESGRWQPHTPRLSSPTWPNLLRRNKSRHCRLGSPGRPSADSFASRTRPGPGCSCCRLSGPWSWRLMACLLFTWLPSSSSDHSWCAVRGSYWMISRTDPSIDMWARTRVRPLASVNSAPPMPSSSSVASFHWPECSCYSLPRPPYSSVQSPFFWPASTPLRNESSTSHKPCWVSPSAGVHHGLDRLSGNHWSAGLVPIRCHGLLGNRIWHDLRASRSGGRSSDRREILGVAIRFVDVDRRRDGLLRDAAAAGIRRLACPHRLDILWRARGHWSMVSEASPAAQADRADSHCLPHVSATCVGRSRHLHRDGRRDFYSEVSSPACWRAEAPRVYLSNLLDLQVHVTYSGTSSRPWHRHRWARVPASWFPHSSPVGSSSTDRPMSDSIWILHGQAPVRPCRPHHRWRGSHCSHTCLRNTACRAPPTSATWSGFTVRSGLATLWPFPGLAVKLFIAACAASSSFFAFAMAASSLA